MYNTTVCDIVLSFSLGASVWTPGWLTDEFLFRFLFRFLSRFPPQYLLPCCPAAMLPCFPARATLLSTFPTIKRRYTPYLYTCILKKKRNEKCVGVLLFHRPCPARLRLPDVVVGGVGGGRGWSKNQPCRLPPVAAGTTGRGIRPLAATVRVGTAAV